MDVHDKWGEEMSDLIEREDAIEVAYQLRRKPNDEEWNCDYFKIIQEPLRVGKDIYDLGRAECTNFDLVVDFINHGKLKRLECIDETMGEREGE